MPWHIKSWSREKGRGTIESEHYPDVPFDAACADVDDFRVGEVVSVKTTTIDGALRITRVWPDDPRFKPEGPASAAPALDPDLRASAERTLAQRDDCVDYRIASLTEESILIEGDDSLFEYGHLDELVIQRPAYLDLPLWSLEIKSLRLSTDAERAHIHSNKFRLGAGDLTLTVIGPKNQFHFIVGAGLTYRRTR